MADADPQWVRETLCEDLADSDRDAGRLPHTPSIEAKVDGDIARWAAERREAKHAPSAHTTDVQKSDEAQRRAEERAASSALVESVGLSENGLAPDYDPDVAPKYCQCGGVCTPCRLRFRIAALMEPVPELERKRTSPGESWQNCRHPKYAKEILHAWVWMILSRKAYVHKHKGELDRIVLRKLEDICDRSTAVVGLGQWR